MPPQNPPVLSYLAMRRAVGIIALVLPAAAPLAGNPLPTSISGYYYVGMLDFLLRSFLVGSLCAVAMFQLGCRGYDRRDELAGILSAVCAIGVAFFPTAPENASALQRQIGYVHYTFAGLLFLTLAYFCLFLFRLTNQSAPTDRKLLRNRVYQICGWIILASIAAVGVFAISGRETLFGLGVKLICETTALVAFGIAWLVKGETFLKDLPIEADTTTAPKPLAKAHIA